MINTSVVEYEKSNGKDSKEESKYLILFAIYSPKM